MTIAQHGRITCEQARDEAKRKLAAVTLGADPRAERDATRLAPTLSQLCADYLAATEAGAIITRRGKAKSASTLLIDRGRIRNHVEPLLGKKLARDLKASDVRALLAAVTIGKTATSGPSGKLRGRIDVEGGKGTAKKAVTLVSAILAYGVEAGVLTETVARGVRLPADGKREVSDPEGMLRALGLALDQADEHGENRFATDAIRVAVLTGMRFSEVIGLRRSELRFDYRAIRLENTKTGQSTRPLNEHVRLVLMWHWQLHLNETFVFGNEGSDKPYGGLPNAVRRICTADYLDAETVQALNGFSMHIARHLFASVANSIGINEFTLAALLGHSKGSVTSGYVSLIDAHLLSAANKTAFRVKALMSDGVPIAKAGLDNESGVCEPAHESEVYELAPENVMSIKRRSNQQ